MANRTDTQADTVHGTNPQYLVDRIVRCKIYNDAYWKEFCFGLTAETFIDRAAEIDYVGGTYGGRRRPAKFLCLMLKLLQIQPDEDVIMEYIKQPDLKYLRALGCMYLRVVGKATLVFQTLEPFFADYRKLRYRNIQGKLSIIHMDELIDWLFTELTVFDVTMTLLPKRETLELLNGMSARRSVLEDDLEDLAELEAQLAREAEADAEKAGARDGAERVEADVSGAAEKAEGRIDGGGLPSPAKEVDGAATTAPAESGRGSGGASPRARSRSRGRRSRARGARSRSTGRRSLRRPDEGREKRRRSRSRSRQPVARSRSAGRGRSRSCHKDERREKKDKKKEQEGEKGRKDKKDKEKKDAKGAPSRSDEQEPKAAKAKSKRTDNATLLGVESEGKVRKATKDDLTGGEGAANDGTEKEKKNKKEKKDKADKKEKKPLFKVKPGDVQAAAAAAPKKGKKEKDGDLSVEETNELRKSLGMAPLKG